MLCSIATSEARNRGFGVFNFVIVIRSWRCPLSLWNSMDSQIALECSGGGITTKLSCLGKLRPCLCGHARPTKRVGEAPSVKVAKNVEFLTVDVVKARNTYGFLSFDATNLCNCRTDESARNDSCIVSRGQMLKTHRCFFSCWVTSQVLRLSTVGLGYLSS